MLQGWNQCLKSATYDGAGVNSSLDEECVYSSKTADKKSHCFFEKGGIFFCCFQGNSGFFFLPFTPAPWSRLKYCAPGLIYLYLLRKLRDTHRYVVATCVVHTREIHPLEPQRHRHSMLAPRVCAPRVTRCSLGHVIWSVQLACSILSRSDSCQGGGRQRHLMMHGQCPIPVYSSQGQPKKLNCIM